MEEAMSIIYSRTVLGIMLVALTGACGNPEDISSKHCQPGLSYYSETTHACEFYKQPGEECFQLIYDRDIPSGYMCAYPDSPTVRFLLSKPSVVPSALQTAQQMGNCQVSSLKQVGGNTYTTTNLPISIEIDSIITQVYLGGGWKTQKNDDGFVIGMWYEGLETTHLMLTCDKYTSGKDWWVWGIKPDPQTNLPKAIFHSMIVADPNDSTKKVYLYKDYTGASSLPIVNGAPQRGYLVSIADL